MFITTTTWGLATHILDIMGVQDIKWIKGALQAQGIIYFLWKRNESHQFGTGFSVNHRIGSAVTRVGFVIDKVSYIDLGGS